MDELNKLLHRQHMEWAHRIYYIGYCLKWKTVPGYMVPLMRGRR